MNPSFARGTFRLSVGRFTDEEDIAFAANSIFSHVSKQLEASEQLIPSTKRLYYLDSYKFVATAIVLKTQKLNKEEKTKLKIERQETSYLMDVILDKTIFHPQGGGQPSDEGKIVHDGKIFKVVKLFQEEDLVHHIVEIQDQDTISLGSEVKLILDETSRRLHARIHSAGHLIDLAVSKVDKLAHLIATKGCHFPGRSYVEYDGKIDNSEKESLAQAIQESLDHLLDTKGNEKTSVLASNSEKALSNCLAFADFKDSKEFATGDLTDKSKLRIVFVGNEIGCPCGGTHVKKISEIGRVNIEKIQYKKKITKVTVLIVIAIVILN